MRGIRPLQVACLTHARHGGSSFEHRASSEQAKISYERWRDGTCLITQVIVSYPDPTDVIRLSGLGTRLGRSSQILPCQISSGE